MVFYLLLFLVIVFGAAYIVGRRRSISIANAHPDLKLHSRPGHYGMGLALLTTVPSLVVLTVWGAVSGAISNHYVTSNFTEHLQSLSLPAQQAFLRDAKAIAYGGIVSFKDATKEQAAQIYAQFDGYANIILALLVIASVAAGFFFGYRAIKPRARFRNHVERFVRFALLLASGVAVLTTAGIVLSLIFETIQFFKKVSFFDFLFGLHWSPQSAFEGADGEGSSADYSLVFGAIPLFTGTLLITFIAMLVAAPIGLMAAIYLSDYAGPGFRSIAKPLLEILAGIPTVVYGFFAALTVAPAFRGFGEQFGLSVSSESALAAGVVMGIMIIPFVSSLSDDVINAVPQSLRDGSAGLGATKSETIRKVVLPAALPGIVSALLLAVSRAIGETMIVVMAAGLAANLTFNPLEAVTTVTVQIVTLLVGDQEFDSAKTLAAFSLGLMLFCITLVLNIIAMRVVNKYREQYD